MPIKATMSPYGSKEGFLVDEMKKNHGKVSHNMIHGNKGAKREGTFTDSQDSRELMTTQFQ